MKPLSEKVFMVIVVNQTCHSLTGGSLEIASTVPLNCAVGLVTSYRCTYTGGTSISWSKLLSSERAEHLQPGTANGVGFYIRLFYFSI